MALFSETWEMRAVYSIKGWLVFAVLWALPSSLQIESLSDLISLCMKCHSSAWNCVNLAFAKLCVIRMGCRPQNQALKPLDKGI